MARTIFLAAAVALASLGCRATIPDGRFACSVDADCPPSQRCVAGTCRRTVDPGADGGMADGGGTCGECDDGQYCNGIETCGGSGCVDGTPPCAGPCDEALDACEGGPQVPVRFVDATFRAASIRVVRADTTLAELAYGETSAPIMIPMGANTIDVRDAAGMTLVEEDVTLDGPSVVVVSPADDVAHALTVVPDDLAAGAIRVFDGLASGPIGVRFDVTAADPVWLSPRETSSDFFAVGTEFLLSTFADDGTSVAAVASFGALALTDEGALVVLSGDAHAHPMSDSGPRAFAVTTGDGVLTLPDPQVALLHSTTDGDRSAESERFFCFRVAGAGTGAFAMHAGEMTMPAGLPAPPRGPDELFVASTETSACLGDASARRLDLAGLAAGGRYVVVLTGTASTGNVELGIVSEPPPPDGTTTATVTWANWTLIDAGFGDVPLGVRVTSPIVLDVVSDLAHGDQGDYTAPVGFFGGTFEVEIVRPSQVLGRFAIESAPRAPQYFEVIVDGPTSGSYLLRDVRAPFGMAWSMRTLTPL